jgi:DNA polymerase-3 subunit gamma/tau
VPYVVLARKYRPQAFPDLIGQEAMVRTLRNAFATGRIAQGYMLTGVRGVGKTTTARILARGLNYETDTVSTPTVDMPVLGRHCAEIIASRHPDVVEMDAASNTGVDNVREIIENVRYRPISARMKVYIVDEVHMLSKGAFNALLKTLEEPPEHTKFIFATTEVRRVPVTVLSRCQRFDLRRVDVPVLAAHLTHILTREGATADDDAVALIARAAEGSVRDGLSILDQAIAMAGGARVSAGIVRAMLGLSDRGRILDLLEAVLSGAIGPALEQLAALHRDGADPVQVLADLAETVHRVTRAKVVGRETTGDTLSPDERWRIETLAGQLSVPLLSRVWQMLQKGHEEAQRAGDGVAAAEMVLIRIAHTADLPAPDELIRLLGGDAPARRSPSVSAGDTARGPASPDAAQARVPAQAHAPPPPPPDWALDVATDGGPPPDLEQAGFVPAGHDDFAGFEPVGIEAELDEVETGTALPATVAVASFDDVVALAGQRRDAILKLALEEHVSLVRFDAAAGSIDLYLQPGAPKTLPNELREKLGRWTGRPWIVVLSKTPGATPLGEVRRAREARERAIIEQHPAVKAVLDAFPEARIAAIRRQTVTRGDDEGGTGTPGDADTGTG